MIIRKYKPSDCEYLAQLFYETIHAVNIKDYTEEQIEAWTEGCLDMAKWNDRLAQTHTLVAIDDETIVGFGSIEETGNVDMLFVHKKHQHKGIASLICDELEKSVDVSAFTTESSITAKPFFEQRGYEVIKEQEVECNNKHLLNYCMVKNV